MHPRRVARETVLKALYAYHITNDGTEKILQDSTRWGNLDPETTDYVRKLFTTTVENRDWTEKLIKKYLENWDYGRIALLDRLILMMAISEIYFMDEIPPKVSISEAIEIAKVYSTEDSSGFVNGILDAIYKHKLAENHATKVKAS
jgi:N utilization substance protein B